MFVSKKMIWLVASLLILLVTVGIVITLTVDADRFRDLIEQRAEAALGTRCRMG